MLTAVVLLLAPLGLAPAQDFLESVDTYLASQVEASGFSGSVLVAEGGEVLFAKGYGLANAEHGIPNRPETKFRLGSVSKQFTAAAILLLQQDGKLAVTDRASEHLEGLPEAWSAITIHQLLTHTSGIFNVTNLASYSSTWTLPSRPRETMARVFDLPLDFESGTRFSYSNTGYVALAAIVEQASGGSWEDFLRTRLLDPAGMQDSGHDTFAAILPQRATGMTMGPNGLEHAPYHNMDMPIGGGDVYSTVLDMVKWDQALFEEGLLSEESLAAMLTPELSGYAYGLVLREAFGQPVVEHSGGINGFSTHVARYPEAGIQVVVLSNFDRSPSSQIAAHVAGLLFGG